MKSRKKAAETITKIEFKTIPYYEAMATKRELEANLVAERTRVIQSIIKARESEAIREFVKVLTYGRKQDTNWIVQFMQDYLFDCEDSKSQK